MWVYAIKDIKKNEELSYDYGLVLIKTTKTILADVIQKMCWVYCSRRFKMANKKTEVDIILPNFNSSRFIDKTIQSVINQSFKNWKLIIVDDSSDEKTKKKIKKI